MKKIREKFAEGLMVIPIPVYLIVVSVLNYIMGSLMAVTKCIQLLTLQKRVCFFTNLF